MDYEKAIEQLKIMDTKLSSQHFIVKEDLSALNTAIQALEKLKELETVNYELPEKREIPETVADEIEWHKSINNEGWNELHDIAEPIVRKLKKRVADQQSIIDNLKAEPKEICPILYGTPGVDMKPLDVFIHEKEDKVRNLKMENERLKDKCGELGALEGQRCLEERDIQIQQLKAEVDELQFKYAVVREMADDRIAELRGKLNDKGGI